MSEQRRAVAAESSSFVDESEPLSTETVDLFDKDALTGLEDVELFEEDSGVVGFDNAELFSQEDALDLLGLSRTRLHGTE
jgi:hypothetical protein